MYNSVKVIYTYLTIIPRVLVGYDMVVISYPTSANEIIVLLNFMSFANFSILENDNKILF